MASPNAVHLSGRVCCSGCVCDILVYPRMCLSLPAHCRNNVHVTGSCGCSVPTVGWVPSVRLSLQSRLSLLVCRHDFQHKPFQVLSLPLTSTSPLSKLPVLAKVAEAVAQVFKPCPIPCHLRGALCLYSLGDTLSLPEMWLLFIFWRQ